MSGPLQPSQARLAMMAEAPGVGHPRRGSIPALSLQGETPHFPSRGSPEAQPRSPREKPKSDIYTEGFNL